MYDVVVVGGGLVGSGFALDLALQNPALRIALVELKQPDFTQNQISYDNKIYALSPANLKHLLALGVKPDLNRFGTINAMNVRGNPASQIEFSKHDCQSAYLAKIVEYRNLHQAIYAELNQLTNLEFVFAEIEQLDNLADHVEFTTTCGRQFSSRWLVAADGANSMIRQRCNIVTEEIPYFQSGVVANFTCSKAHLNVAHQWFLGDGVLAYLPLPDQQISIVWSTDNVRELLEATPSELCRKVAQAGEFQLGELELLTPAQDFPLKLRLVKQFYAGRVILIGDAAHTIHPLAGQGVNLGFGDAWALAEIMAAKAGMSVAQLARYNYQRLSEVRKMQMTCHLLHRLFHNRNRGVVQLRSWGLNFVNQFTSLKKALINSAINY